jgi:hypothetical protein
MRNRSLTYRMKNCRRGRLGRGKTISRSSKDFAATVYTTFCVQPKINEHVKFPWLSIKIKSANMSPRRYRNDINKTIHFEKNCRNVLLVCYLAELIIGGAKIQVCSEIRKASDHIGRSGDVNAKLVFNAPQTTPAG